MDQERSANRSRRIAAVVIAIAVVAVAAFALGRLAAGVSSAPSSTSAAAGFARDMQVHHNQGVELANILRDNTDDEELRLLAFDIASTQQQQSGQMFGWLNVWNLPQASPEPSMTWMTRPTLDGEGHDHGTEGAHQPGDPMPGLATDADIAELKSLTGVEAEKKFLELMIAHHEGAIEMAEAALDRTEEPVVVEMANGIINSQTPEIAYMQELLAARS
jgi:uncharacterized protein (DUF305 family)